MASGSIKVVIARSTRHLYTFAYRVLKEMSQISQLREQSRLHVVHKWLLGKSTVQRYMWVTACVYHKFNKTVVIHISNNGGFPKSEFSQTPQHHNPSILQYWRLWCCGSCNVENCDAVAVRKQQVAIVGSTWAWEHFARLCTFTLAACDTTSHIGLLKMPHPRVFQFSDEELRTETVMFWGVIWGCITHSCANPRRTAHARYC